LHERCSSEICPEKAKTRSSRGQVEHRRAGGKLHSRRYREIEWRVFQVINRLLNRPELETFITAIYNLIQTAFRLSTFQENSYLKEIAEIFAHYSFKLS
jgi:hypothetical protein